MGFSRQEYWSGLPFASPGLDLNLLYSLGIQHASLLNYKISAKKPNDSVMRVLLYITSCFSLAAFSILSLLLIFAIIFIMCFLWTPLSSYCLGPSVLLDRDICSLFQVKEVLCFYFFKWVLCPFLSPISFWVSMMQFFVYLILPHRCLKLCSIFKILFSLFCSSQAISTILCQFARMFIGVM